MGAMLRIARGGCALFCLIAFCTPSFAKSHHEDLQKSVEQMVDGYGLSQPQVKPWHIRANVSLINSNGTAGESGTVDVWHASESFEKLVYSFPSFHQVATTAKGEHFVAGDIGQPPPGLDIWLRTIKQPIRTEALGSDAKLKGSEIKLDSERLSCIQSEWFLKRTIKNGTAADERFYNERMQAFCSLPGQQVLRYVVLADQDFLHSEKFGLRIEASRALGDRKIPEKSTVLFGRRPFLHVEVTEAEPIDLRTTHIAPSAFARPQSDADHDEVEDFAIRKSFASEYDESITHSRVNAQMIVRIQLKPDGTVIKVQPLASNEVYFAERLTEYFLTWKFPAAKGEPSGIRTYNVVLQRRDPERDMELGAPPV